MYCYEKPRIRKCIVVLWVFVSCIVVFVISYIYMGIANITLKNTYNKQISELKYMSVGYVNQINAKINYYEEIERQFYELKLKESMFVSQESEIKSLEEMNQDIAQEKRYLEDTILKFASTGERPQNYKIINSRGECDRDNLEYIGVCKITFYNPDEEDCNKNDGITYSGEAVIPGYTVAADLNYWKLDTKIYISGWGMGIIKDIGSAVKGKYVFDVCTFNKELSRSGIHIMDVYIVKE